MTKSYTYLKDVQELPLLTKEREYELGSIIQKYKSGKQKESAIIELVEHNLKLVAQEAHRYSSRSQMDIEELYNAGKIGLIVAAYGYNPDKFNNRFSTYATHWVRQKIREAVYNDAPVSIPVHVINSLYRKKKLVDQYSDLTPDQIREALDLTEAQMDKVDKAIISPFSLDATISKNSKDEKVSIGELIPDESATIPGHDELTDDRYDYLTDAMSELDEMSKDIIYHQIISDEKMKLSDLGKKHGVSGERIRQIKQKALEQLKQKIGLKMLQNS